jgi:hypothetical protein
MDARNRVSLPAVEKIVYIFGEDHIWRPRMNEGQLKRFFGGIERSAKSFPAKAFAEEVLKIQEEFSEAEKRVRRKLHDGARRTKGDPV